MNLIGLPQCGLSHFEMNAGKSFMSLCWDVFMKKICKELGFQSENALKYIKKGSDHHKLWDILEITYISFTDELLISFICPCNLQNIEPTVRVLELQYQYQKSKLYFHLANGSYFFTCHDDILQGYPK